MKSGSDGAGHEGPCSSPSEPGTVVELDEFLLLLNIEILIQKVKTLYCDGENG